MIAILAQVLGFAAVALYLISYQMKKRSQIVWITFFSNLFYVVQYFLLGAFSGAVLDMLSSGAAFLAVNKYNPRLKKYNKWFVTGMVVIFVVVGLAIAYARGSWLELIPIGGAVFQSVSLWCDKEQTIRKLGLCGAPCWLVYNFLSKAYGPALGSLFAIISIIVSLVRYRKKSIC